MGPCFKGYLSYKFDRPEAIRERAKTDEFLPSLGPETLQKLFGALDASEKFSYSSLWDSVKCGCGRRMRMADGGRDSYKKKIRNK